MIQSKTICLENSTEIHIDPALHDVQLAVKVRDYWGRHELVRVRISPRKRAELIAALEEAKEAV